MQSYLDPARAAFDLFKALPRDEPIWMLNLVQYRALAEYPAGHAHAGQGLTGARAYKLYGEISGPIFDRVGGAIAWRGNIQLMLTGPEGEAWDTVFIAHYPSAGAFLAMVTDPDYRRAVVHRQAAVFNSRLVRCQQGDAGGRFA
jgi:uncharacterized protein (DUF1330 family)